MFLRRLYDFLLRSRRKKLLYGMVRHVTTLERFGPGATRSSSSGGETYPPKGQVAAWQAEKKKEALCHAGFPSDLLRSIERLFLDCSLMFALSFARRLIKTTRNLRQTMSRVMRRRAVSLLHYFHKDSVRRVDMDSMSQTEKLLW